MIEKEPLAVLRGDGQPEPRADAIRQDWRAWASAAGYHQRRAVPVSAAGRSVTFEIWARPAAPDMFLLYHPWLPSTSNTECLFILADRGELQSMLDATLQMARVVLGMVGARDTVAQEQKAQQN